PRAGASSAGAPAPAARPAPWGSDRARGTARGRSRRGPARRRRRRRRAAAAQTAARSLRRAPAGPRDRPAPRAKSLRFETARVPARRASTSAGSLRAQHLQGAADRRREQGADRLGAAELRRHLPEERRRIEAELAVQIVLGVEGAPGEVQQAEEALDDPEAAGGDREADRLTPPGGERGDFTVAADARQIPL